MEYGSEIDDESGEVDVGDFFEDECEEGEIEMDDYGEEGEMEFMELADGEELSGTNSSDAEEEAVREIMGDEKRMKAIKKEAKALGMKEATATEKQ